MICLVSSLVTATFAEHPAYLCILQWSIPEVPDKNAGTDQPTIVYYPHFASVQMHSDYIDW